MNILTFVLDHWHDFLVGIVLVAACIAGIIQWIKVQGPVFNAMSPKEKLAYITRLLTNLVPMALVLVTDAEIQFGGETGPLKRSYVISELYKLIPDEYKKYITEENLDTIIENVLPEARKLWEATPAMQALVKGVDISYAE